jgi:sarcosine oxidase delta subunit
MHFTSALPERDENGIVNDIYCPHCGDLNTYPDTAQGAAESVKALTESENIEIAWNN